MPTSDERGLLDELITVRDWLRYAVTSMTRANLVYGHGTTNAVDEAAFLLLATLDLPIDNIDPWLDARLTAAERQAIAAVISRRIETRKPAAYLTNTAYIQGRKFYVDDRVIVPRSLIGELLAQDRLAADRSRRAGRQSRSRSLHRAPGASRSSPRRHSRPRKFMQATSRTMRSPSPSATSATIGSESACSHLQG